VRPLHRVEEQVGRGLLILYMSLTWIRDFQFDQAWRGQHYHTKQVEAYAVQGRLAGHHGHPRYF
jgi:hypothetical protein